MIKNFLHFINIKTILTLLFPVLIFAQDYELGKVAVSELSQKKHPTDTSAVAAVLFEKGKTIFDYSPEDGFFIVTEVEVKIKIYKKEGLDFANKKIDYYFGDNNKENVIIQKAFTYNLVNGKIEKTKLSNNGEFKENLIKNWKTIKFIMPNVKVGSIIEYKYSIKSPNISNLQEWNFQSTIPVDYSEYKTFIPEYFSYNFYSKGKVNLQKESSTKSRSINIYNKEFVAGISTVLYHEPPSVLTILENVTCVFAKNISAFIKEPYMDSHENYISAIQYQLASVKYPNEDVKQYSDTWEDVVKTIYKNEFFGKEVLKNEYFQKEITSLVNAKQLDTHSTIHIIYEFVKNHYKWNDYYGIYTDVGVENAFRDKVGNVTEINFTLISMLRNAGFKANPILLSTNNKVINMFPSSSAFNYVICGVELEDKIIYLDATDKYLAENVLPNRALNYIGRIVRENGTSQMVDLSPKVHSKKSVMIFATVSPDQIKGNIKESITENRAYNFRDTNNGISEDSYLEKAEKETTGLEISDYTIENKTNLKEPVKEEYNFVLTNQVETINDKLYFKPLLFFGIDENPFKSETRDYPIDFKYPSHDSYTITYNLPQGYVVESMPEKINIATEDNLASLSFLTGDMGNKVQIVANLYINSALIPADYYDSIKSFFNEVFVKMNQKIVLKKQ